MPQLIQETLGDRVRRHVRPGLQGHSAGDRTASGALATATTASTSRTSSTARRRRTTARAAALSATSRRTATASSSSRTSSPQAPRSVRPCRCSRAAADVKRHRYVHLGQPLRGRPEPRTRPLSWRSSEEFGIKVHAIVTVQDIREYLADKAEYAHLLPLMDAYMKQYCVF